MSKYIVVVVSLGYESYAIESEILRAVDAELILAPRNCLTEEEVVAAASDADAILVREAPVSARVIDALTRCKAIVRYGVGVDNIDLEHARRRGIYVANLPGYGTEEVSDHAAALLLACIRRLHTRDANLRQGRFEADIQEPIFRTTGKTLGLIGYGQIGRALHRKWKGFLPQRVLIFDPFAQPEIIRENGAEAAALDTLFAESDYISLHAPLTLQTRHIINAANLGKMKPTAILVNTARGDLIDEKALAKALSEGRLAAAGLDVFEQEPLASDHPFISLSNVVLSGHVGWYSKDAVRELQTRGAQEIVRVLSGGVPQCWVNRW
ncbi:MAG: C-terminal binding protein [Deltaproteobacteria bacterium]|nr:C-terminal binding protein [Deltaproteobacteria bacterium]